MNVRIAAARILYCFDFEEFSDNAIDTMAIPQLTKNSAPFKAKVKCRSEAHAVLIRKNCEEAVNARY